MDLSFLSIILDMTYGQVSNYCFNVCTEINVSVHPDYYPHDGVATDKASVILPVAVLLILFDIVGLLFAIVCLVFNLLYRNKKQAVMITYCWC